MPKGHHNSPRNPAGRPKSQTKKPSESVSFRLHPVFAKWLKSPEGKKKLKLWLEKEVSTSKDVDL